MASGRAQGLLDASKAFFELVHPERIGQAHEARRSEARAGDHEEPLGHARPHDVAPAPDGAVWYTAQGQGALGPCSGAVEFAAARCQGSPGKPLMIQNR